MVVIALLLLLVVAAVVVFVVVTGSTGTTTLEWDQLNLLFAPSPLVLFLLGAATMLLALAAVAMLRAGSKRSIAKRRELKRLRRLEGEQGRPVDRTGTAPVVSSGEATRHDGQLQHGTPHGAQHGDAVAGGTTGVRVAPTHPDVQQHPTSTQTTPVRPADGKDGSWNDSSR